MPYEHTLPKVQAMLFTNPPEAFRIIAIMAGGAFTRVCLSSSNSHLKRLDDLFFCILAFYCICPFIPVMPTTFGIQVPRGTIAISLLGSHIIYALVKFLIKCRTVVNLTTGKNV
ncbi:hypothetical protein [Huaxiibacter chinensis]|jgi:hypothetical protein|uniref:hypothetical protein n=1 Tax=Huaxiibacter chinensis TaxID=2899785 RepID=UPI003D313CC6